MRRSGVSVAAEAVTVGACATEVGVVISRFERRPVADAFFGEVVSRWIAGRAPHGA